MARQRFIHPELWEDPVFGKLQPAEMVLFIGLFSIADDEGRLLADPAFLRSQLFPFKDYTNKKVGTMRDAVVAAMANVHLYRAEGYEYIALLKWKEYQKPKYPKPSKLPAPFLEDSPNLPPRLPEDFPNDSSPGREGLGRDGLEMVGQGWGAELESEAQDAAPSTDLDIEIEKLLALDGCDENSRTVVTVCARKLPLAAVADIRLRAQEGCKPVRWAVKAMQLQIEERSAA